MSRVAIVQRTPNNYAPVLTTAESLRILKNNYASSFKRNDFTTEDSQHMVPANKGKKLPPEPLTEAEVKALIRACSPKSAIGIRNRAVIAVLFRAGLRISEALSLYPKDLDAANSTIRILRGKGGSARTLALDEFSWAVIELWLVRRAALGIDGRSPVFCTLRGRPISAAYFRTLLPRLGRKAGIQKRCHPHGLRHSLSAQLASENVPLHIIQQSLGHRHASTTDHYLKSLHPRDVVETLKARAWIF